jgi:hypothetical protein
MRDLKYNAALYDSINIAQKYVGSFHNCFFALRVETSPTGRSYTVEKQARSKKFSVIGESPFSGARRQSCTKADAKTCISGQVPCWGRGSRCIVCDDSCRIIQSKLGFAHYFSGSSLMSPGPCNARG